MGVRRGAWSNSRTPWLIIVERIGVVRFNDFHLEAQEAIKLIDQLKKKTASPD